MKVEISLCILILLLTISAPLFVVIELNEVAEYQIDALNESANRNREIKNNISAGVIDIDLRAITLLLNFRDYEISRFIEMINENNKILLSLLSMSLATILIQFSLLVYLLKIYKRNITRRLKGCSAAVDAVNGAH